MVTFVIHCYCSFSHVLKEVRPNYIARSKSAPNSSSLQMQWFFMNYSYILWKITNLVCITQLTNSTCCAWSGQLNFVGMQIQVYCKNSLKTASGIVHLLRPMVNRRSWTLSNTFRHCSNVFNRPGGRKARGRPINLAFPTEPHCSNLVINLCTAVFKGALFRPRIARIFSWFITFYKNNRLVYRVAFHGH